MHLEQLPPELLSLIIQSLDSHRHLVNLISASPACYYVYSAAPSVFLGAILRNVIHPAAMHHALAILHAPVSQPSPAKIGPLESKALQDYVERYFQGDGAFPFPTERSELESLYRIYSQIDLLINDYASRATQTLFNGQRNDTLDLSWTELARFQRAFFRHQVYCLSFPMHSYTLFLYNDPFSMSVQHERFISRLDFWEIEEMGCAHFYHTSVVGNVLGRLEDEFIDTVLHCPGAITKQAWDAIRNGTDRDVALGQCHLPIDYNDFGWAEEPGRFRGGRRSYYASLGSSFTYRLAVGNHAAQRDAIRSFCMPSRQFLAEAVGEAIRINPGGPDAPFTVAPADLRDPGPRRPGPGYFLFKIPTKETYMPIGWAEHYTAVRERAYVFWDYERIALTQVAGSLTYAQALGRRFHHDGRGQSVSVRVGNLVIPRAVLGRLKRDYGWLQPSR